MIETWNFKPTTITIYKNSIYLIYIIARDCLHYSDICDAIKHVYIMAAMLTFGLFFATM